MNKCKVRKYKNRQLTSLILKFVYGIHIHIIKRQLNRKIIIYKNQVAKE